MFRLGAVEMPLRGAGSIRKQVFPCHNQIEWDVDYKALLRSNLRNADSLTSPSVQIGNQCYVLEFSRKAELNLDLLRMGPCVDGPAGSVQWWAGWKLDDETYDYRIARGKFFLSKSREAKTLFSCRLNEIERLLFWMRDGRLTFYIRMKNEGTLNEEETCRRSPVEVHLLSTGSITDEEYLCHKQVEWEIDYEIIRKPFDFLTSPAFKIGNQFYVLKFRSVSYGCRLELSEIGPCLDVPARSLRCWAGYKLGGVICYDNIVTGELRPAEMCEIPLIKIFNSYNHSAIGSWQNLLRGRSPTFFIRLKEMGAPTKEMMSCTHRVTNVSARSVGRIDEEEWTSYKHAEWNIDFDPTTVSVISPVFAVGIQSCFLKLRENSVEFFRMGPPINEFARCWITVKNGDQSHDYNSSFCRELCLSEDCELWKMEFMFTFDKIERKERLVVDFVMTLKTDSYARQPLIRDGVRALQDSDDLSSGYVSFHVKDKIFSMHKAILQTRVPVMKAMFRNGYVENRTGVVRIEDCEPEIFQEFLEFLYYHDKWNSVRLNNAFELYVLTDRYLFTELKTDCLDAIGRTLSIDTFVDALRLALRYGENSLLEKAAYFFSQNKSIVETKSWQDFYAEIRDVANSLINKTPQTKRDDLFEGIEYILRFVDKYGRM